MQFNKAMIPDDVTSFEQLIAWGGACLNFNGFTRDYQERQPSAALGDQGVQAEFERTGPFRAYDNSPRIIFRFGLKLKPDYASTVYAMDYQAIEEVLISPANVDFLNPAYQA